MDYIKSLPLPPPRCRSAPHQLPLATAVCNIAICNLDGLNRIFNTYGALQKAIIPICIWIISQ